MASFYTLHYCRIDWSAGHSFSDGEQEAIEKMFLNSGDMEGINNLEWCMMNNYIVANADYVYDLSQWCAQIRVILQEFGVEELE